ncbi:MAG: hypothetical protein P1V21_12265 [Rhizobiaceae bacterium]|nr:hypothetical protein [Rhizobiaceae bacterium]
MKATGKRPMLLVVAIYILLLSGGWFAGHWVLDFINFEAGSADEPMLNVMIMVTAMIFILASALPFVPGAEIGLGLMMMFGGRIALLVYFCMLAALLIAFLIGRYVPLAIISAGARHLGLIRTHRLVAQLIPLSDKERLALLTTNAPQKFVPALLRFRYLAIMVLLNLPGNSIIGGGGGIAFTAGVSGLFSFPAFLATVAMAIAPIPLLVFFLN